MHVQMIFNKVPRPLKVERTILPKTVLGKLATTEKDSLLYMKIN